MNSEFDRYYIKIRTILGIDAKTIHEEVTAVLGLNAPSYRTIARWADYFRKGREVATDEPRSSWPVSELRAENIELVRQIINNDPHSIYDKIIAETSLSLSWYNRTDYSRLSQDENNDILLGSSSSGQ